jgi:disulfide bond formation protein DsbB
MKPFPLARTLALLIPAALMAGALGAQFLGGLYPCEMCHWQRWPHYAAIGLVLLSFAIPGEVIERMIVLMAAVAILISGGIGLFHAGVEYGWWEGMTKCAVMPGAGGGSVIDDIMKTPLVRCDQAPWTLAGISLAGFNGIISVLGGLAIIRLLQKRV